MKTRLISLQFAYFFNELVERPDIRFKDINAEVFNIFDAIPQIIPVPLELPSDVPIIILRSNTNKYVCNISRARLDFILTRDNDVVSNEELLNDFNVKLKGLNTSVLGKQDISRFGLVARYFHNNSSAISTIRNKYFQNTVDGSSELSLRFNKATDYMGLKVNDIVEISSAEISINNGALEKGIFIQRDINNNAIADKVIKKEDLHQISNKFSQKITESEIEGLVR